VNIFGHALLVTAIAVGIPAVVIIATAKGRREMATIGAIASGVVILLINWLVIYLARPVVGISTTSFYQSFWMWMLSALFAIIVIGACSYDWNSYGGDTIAVGLYVAGALWAVVMIYGFLNMANGVWTESRAQTLAHEVHAVQTKVGSYPDTDANHIVVVPEQVARRSASVAMSSGSGNLSTAYQLLEPQLQSVGKHAYWIIGMRPSGWRANNRVHGLVPGYVVVDAEDPSAPATVRTKDATGKKLSIAYSDRGSFSHNLDRHVWTHGYAGTPVQDWTLEVNDQWQPYWTASANRLTMNFVATVPNSLLTVNAQSGAIQRYSLENMPKWVDRIYSADTVREMLNWWGNYATNKSYGFLGMGRSSVNRFQVHGNPTLVYTKEGYPVWQVEMSSRNNDSSVAYLALFNGRDDTVRLYQIPDLPLESTVVNAVENSNQNIRKLTPAHLALHKIYGKLTWVAPLVPNEDGDVASSATMQGVALIPADSQLSGGDIIIEQSMSKALNDYQTLLNGSATVKPGEDASLAVKTGVVTNVSAPINENGKTVFYFTLKSDAHSLYRVGIDPAADNSNLEVPLIKTGKKVTISYRDTGSARRDVQSYDDLSVSIGK
jgi:hypothetical protein